MSDDAWIILTAVLTAASCAVVGTFLVLRRMSLLGDAISHSALPGIVLAYLVTRSLDVVPMVIGAAAAGLGTALLIEAIRRSGRLPEDAAVGSVFPAAFALGVVLLTALAGQVHLDAECALFGEIGYVALPGRELVVGGADLGPRAAWVAGAAVLVNGALVGLLWKQLKLGTFDPESAAVQGLRPGMVQLLLTGATALTTVAAFEAVGAVLVVALLTVPAATAYLLAESLGAMLLTAVGVGCVAAVGGFFAASTGDGGLNIAGCMAVMCGVLFVPAWLFAPGHGVIARRLAARRHRARWAGELLLGKLPSGGMQPSAGPAGSEAGPGQGARAEDLAARLRWTEAETTAALRRLEDAGLARTDARGGWLRVAG